MAQYTVTTYADDSYVKKSTGEVITGSQLSMTGKATYKTDNKGGFGYSTSDENCYCEIKFSHAPQYLKKRLINAQHEIYVRNKSYSFSPSSISGYSGIQYAIYLATNPANFSDFMDDYGGFYSNIPLDDTDNGTGKSSGFSMSKFPNGGYVGSGLSQYPVFNYQKNKMNFVLITRFIATSKSKIKGSANANYIFNANLTIDSHSGAYPPRSIQTYEDVVVTPSTLVPSAGFINRRIINKFSWSLSYNKTDVADEIKQKSAIFQWRIKDSATINSISVGTNQYIEIPAETFPDGLIEWQVQIVSDDNVSSDFSNWMSLTTIDAIPSKPTSLYPNGGIRNGAEAIQFSWRYINPRSSPQYGFEIQITYDSGNTWNDLSGKIVSDITEYISTPNILIPTNYTGQTGWRLRTYNTNDVPGEWSEAAYFVVLAAPQIPDWISIDGDKSRPLCRWDSIGQNGYQMQIFLGEGESNNVIFDTGETYGIDTEYKMPEYLNNGTYIFKVRIKNTQGLWSEWAEYTAAISAPKRLKITLDGQPVEYGARLDFDVEVTASG